MMDMDSLEYGIVNYSTPFYVFDTDELTKRVKQFREITHKRADLCFAMKANPFLVGPIRRMQENAEHNAHLRTQDSQKDNKGR